MGGLVTTQWRLHTTYGEYLIELKHSHTNGMRQLSINGKVVFKLEKNTYDTGGEDSFEIEGKKGIVITRTHHHTFHYQCIYEGIELRKEAKGHLSHHDKNNVPVLTCADSSTSETQTISGISEIGTGDTRDSLGASIAPVAAALGLGIGNGSEMHQNGTSSSADK